MSSQSAPVWVDLGALTGAGRRAAVERVGLEELRIESSPRRAQCVVLRDKQEKPARRQQPAKGSCGKSSADTLELLKPSIVRPEKMSPVRWLLRWSWHHSFPHHSFREPWAPP